MKKLIWVILFLGFFIRLINLSSFEVAGDEGSYMVRGAGWNDTMLSSAISSSWEWYGREAKLPFWTHLSFFDHPPLSFAIIWIFGHIFGLSLFALRLPFVLAGVFSGLLIYNILKKWGANYGALAGAAFFIFLPWHIWVSRQAQQESLLIFFLLLAIYLSEIYGEFLEKKGERSVKKSIWLPFFCGLTLGAAFAIKYSAVIILPWLIFLAIKYKPWKEKNFFYSFVGFFIVTLPQIIYNIILYGTRGHFDLQIARFLHQDISQDWPANVQIFFGGFDHFFDFILNTASSLSIFFVLIFLFSTAYFIINKKIIFWVSWVSFVFTFFIANLALGEKLQSSVMLIYAAFIFGYSIEEIYNYLNKKIFKNIFVAVTVLFIAFECFVGISQVTNTNEWVLNNILVKAYTHPSLGFKNIESWIKINYGIHSSIVNFSNGSEWANILVTRAAFDVRVPIIVYDVGFNWFGINWYFQRHILYTANIAMMPANFFKKPIVEIPGFEDRINGKKAIYIERGDVDFESRVVVEEDETLKFTHDVFHGLAKKQNVKPIEIKNDNGDVFARIYVVDYERGQTLKKMQ